mgnify:CR=1 FL=1|jgi:hypothetical protein|tara:strand:+ start:570 stop:770 length:201 start_codon:yes stop_codon:yes gene_type:complete
MMQSPVDDNLVVFTGKFLFFKFFSRERVLQNKELLGHGNSIFNKLLINIHNSALFKLKINLDLNLI